jgi:hypothetical protein
MLDVPWVLQIRFVRFEEDLSARVLRQWRFKRRGRVASDEVARIFAAVEPALRYHGNLGFLRQCLVKSLRGSLE